jgi:polyhydroxybutyrate depolymerase
MPSRPVPIIIIHGTDDYHIPWNGGEGCGYSGAYFLSIPETVDILKEINGCTIDGTSPYIEMGDGIGEYQGECQNGDDVVLCTIKGGGHHWPGGTSPTPWWLNNRCSYDGPMSTTFSANDVLWKFFKEHPKNR